MSFTTQLTKKQLYKIATIKNINRRSTMNKTELTKAIREHYLTKRFFRKWYNITLFWKLHAVLTHPKNAEALTKEIRKLYLKKKYLKKWYLNHLLIKNKCEGEQPPKNNKKNKKKKWSKAKKKAAKKQKYIMKKYFEKWRNYKREEEQPPSYDESEREEHTRAEVSLKVMCELGEGARNLCGAKKGDFVSNKHTDARFEAMCRMHVREYGDITDARVLEIMLFQKGIQAAWIIHRDINSWCRKEDVMMKGTTEDHPFGNGMFFTFYDRNKVAKDQFFFSVKKSDMNKIFMINTFAENGDTF